jgi:formamidopyrimidine-DNA glycosylase
MPELPDLQVFSHNLTKVLKGKTLEKLGIPQPKKIKVAVKELQKALEGQQLSKVFRSGKELHFEFANGHTLSLHLMLHGQLSIYENGNEPKFVIIDLQFNGGRHLAMSDFQRAAVATLDPAESTVPDALDFDEAYLAKKLSATRTAFKSVLMDQKVLRGIGNAYADEILYHARLSPFSTSNKIPASKIKILARSIHTVLKEAERHLLKFHPDIISGEVRDFLNVHQPKKEKTAAGETIHQKPGGSRKTYFTDEQELYN